MRLFCIACKEAMRISTKGGTRTHTPLQALDFESNVSTNSTTLAFQYVL